MKQLVFVICFSFVMLSCHDRNDVQYEIFNNSDHNVSLFFYRAESVLIAGRTKYIDTVYLPNKGDIILRNKGDIWRSGVYIEFREDYNPREVFDREIPSLWNIPDSVRIVFDRQREIIHSFDYYYYGKNIFERNIFYRDSYESETLKKKKYLYTIFRYSITEEDYENAKEINDNK